jgi:hypothetical protein
VGCDKDWSGMTMSNPPMSVQRIIEIIHDIFNENQDQIAIAFQILR